MSSDSKEGLLASSATLLSLSTIAVGLRFYARKQQKASYSIDDWTAVTALVSYVGAATCAIIACKEKVLGYSTADFTPEETLAMAKTSAQVQVALDVLSTTSLALVKLSALFFYRRVFCVGGPSIWFDVLTKVTIAVVILHLTVFQFLTGFQCGTHFSALWDGGYLEYCLISFPFLYGLTISDFLLDIWILVLPIPLILKLHITPAKKLSIFGIFLLAFIGLGASIARMVALIKDELGGPSYLVTTDEEQTLTSYFFMIVLENGMSLVAVNLPSLWLLFTSSVPERLVRSIRSAISIFSTTSSHSQDNTAGQVSGVAEGMDASETDSVAADKSAQRSIEMRPLHQFRTDLEGQSFEAKAAHSREDPTPPAEDVIHVQHTVELRRE